jgi:hypothetical protein
MFSGKRRPSAMLVMKYFSMGSWERMGSILGQSRSRVMRNRAPESRNWWTISVSM